MTESVVPARLIVMGVTGCGKSTVGALLARHLGAVFVDGDDYHPPANVAKMASGMPLTDEDRWPWLDRLGEVMEETVHRQGRVVLACSALRRVYRDRLSGAAGGWDFTDAAGRLYHDRATGGDDARGAYFDRVRVWGRTE